MTAKTTIQLEDEVEGLTREVRRAMPYAERWAKITSLPELIKRAFITGVFTALGATVGFALLIFFVSKIITSFSGIPFIEKFLEQTKLDKIIDYQLQQIEKRQDTPTPTAIPTIAPTSIPANQI